MLALKWLQKIPSDIIIEYSGEVQLIKESMRSKIATGSATKTMREGKLSIQNLSSGGQFIYNYMFGTTEGLP